MFISLIHLLSGIFSHYIFNNKIKIITRYIFHKIHAKNKQGKKAQKNQAIQGPKQTTQSINHRKYFAHSSAYQKTPI
jgi:hypothetical protein